MKLYYSKGACSLAPHIIIRELTLACDFISVDLATKKTSTGEDFLKINPKGSVPALQLDNGEVLTENAVIQQYLADMHKAYELLPQLGDFARYRVLEWLNFASTDLHKGFSPLFNRDVPQDVKDQVFKPLLERRLNYLNLHLHGKKFLVGNHLTLPDVYVFVTLNWLGHVGMDIKCWPNLESYHHEIRQRPAVVQAFSDEGLK